MKRVFVLLLVLFAASPLMAQSWGPLTLPQPTAADDLKYVQWNQTTRRYQLSTVAVSADNVIGNEVTNATDTTLTRSGSGTAGSPYTLGLTLSNANTWTAAVSVLRAGITTTLTDGLALVNTTASTSGVPVQQSPALRFEAQAFDTVPGTASDKWEWFIHNSPSPGTTTVGNLLFLASKNSAAATVPLTLTSSGSLNISGSGGSTFGGSITSSGSFRTSVPTSGMETTAANAAGYCGNGIIVEGAVADANEWVLSWPQYDNAVDGDVATVFAPSQGVALALGAGIIPRAGTASGQAFAQTGWQSFVFDYADLSAAATTKDLTLFTLPARSIVQYVICDTGTAATFADTLTLSVGDNSTDYDNWLADWDGKSDLTVGDADVERGAVLPDADTMAAYLPSFTGTTAVVLHADGNGTNLSGLSAGQWTCSVGFTVLP